MMMKQREVKAGVREEEGEIMELRDIMRGYEEDLVSCEGEEKERVVKQLIKSWAQFLIISHFALL